MKLFNLFAIELFILFSFNLKSQMLSDINILYKGHSYDVCTFNTDFSTLNSFNLVQNKYLLPLNEFIDEYSSNYDSIIFAVNACISTNSGEPIGLFYKDSTELYPLNLTTGNGNFYLKPNGVLILSKNGTKIIPSELYKSSDNIVAVQSGPLLLENGKIHPLFNPLSKNLNLRCGVGIFKGKDNLNYLLFCKSNDLVSFYEFASFFKDKYNCNDALCLESAGCTLYSRKTSIISPNNNSVIGNYLIYTHDIDKIHEKTVIQMVKTQGGTFDIPVELNGVLKINFIFDSGASDVTISPDVALTLIRTGTIKQSDFIGTQKYVFANGDTATSQIFLLHEIKLGTHKIKMVRASISNSISAPMLLGQSVLERLGKFSIDNANHTLTIERK